MKEILKFFLIWSASAVTVLIFTGLLQGTFDSSQWSPEIKTQFVIIGTLSIFWFIVLSIDSLSNRPRNK